MKLVGLLTLSGACALRLPASGTSRRPASGTSRREVIGALAGGSAAVALAGTAPAFALGLKGPLADGLSDDKAAVPKPTGRLFEDDERVPAIIKLKAAREQLAQADALLYEQNWGNLRALLASAPLSSVRELTKAGVARSSPDRATFLAAITELDTFTYKQQTKTSFSALTDKKGGCVNARTPRDGLPSCFVDISEPTSALKRAEDALDKILTLPL